MSDKSRLSPARLAANRANAQKSTGPRTAAGKERSRQNSTTHNLTGRLLLLSEADREAYQQIFQGVLDDHRPDSALELQLCHNIADSYLRLSRIRPIEDAMFALAPPRSAAPSPADTIAEESSEPPSPRPAEIMLNFGRTMLNSSQAFANIALYEQRIHRSLKGSIQELCRLQSARAALERAEMPAAINHYKERQMRNLPFDPACDGFVFSTDEIEYAMHLQRRQTQVAAAAKYGFNPANLPDNRPSDIKSDIKEGPKAA